MRIKKKKVQGVTLIETLIYMALFAFIFYALLGFVSFVSSNNVKAERQIEVDRSIIFLTEHFQLNFRRATSIDTTISVFDQNNGSLVLKENTNTITYQVTADRLQIIDNGQTNYLTNSNEIVEKFYIERVMTSKGTTEGAKINIVMRNKADMKIQSELKTLYTLV